MAGTPADLRIYIDPNYDNDHTYYGNGCNSTEYSGDYSITPCSSRIAETVDGESQENGTYYHYQAATSGSSSSVSTDNTNSPDSFCPLGWQMPYGGTGGVYYDKSRSWNYLLTTYDISFNNGTASDVTKIRSYPFSFIFAGRFSWAYGGVNSFRNDSHYWIQTVGDSFKAYRFHIGASLIQDNSADQKRFGFSIRCSKSLSNHPKHSQRNRKHNDSG